jgi:flagellar biogenesis protein FliO
MRTPRIPLLRVALLSTWAVGLATTARADGPVVIPDDQPVNFSVKADEPGAEVALVEQESLPLGGTPTEGLVAASGSERVDRSVAFEGTLSEALRVGLPLLGVVALMIAIGVVVRRVGGPLAGGGRPSGVLEVLGRYPIARGQQLVLLRLVSRVVLLHQTRNGLSTLSEVTDADEVAALLARVEAATRSGPPGRFQGLLAGALVGRDPVSRELPINGKVVVDLTRRAAHRVPRRAEA